MFLGRFPTAFKTATLRTHIRGCFHSVREATVCRILKKYLGKQP